MATLPDLPTDDILVMGYWNCSTAGFDPPTDVTPVIEYGNVTDYSAYDNGVDVTFSESNSNLHGTQEYHVRYKSDGWLIAWFTRDTTYAANTVGAGLHHLLNNVGTVTLPQTTLATVLQKIWGQFPAGSQADFGAADVAYHYPPNPGATTLTVGNAHYTGSGSDSGGFSYSPDTTLYDLIAAGRQHTTDFTYGPYTRFNGTDITFGDTDESGALDLLAQNLAPDPDTSYPMEINGTNISNNDAEWVEIAVIGVWS